MERQLETWQAHDYGNAEEVSQSFLSTESFAGFLRYNSVGSQLQLYCKGERPVESIVRIFFKPGIHCFCLLCH